MASLSRRKFLTTSITGAVGLAILPRFLNSPLIAADAPASPKRIINFAQIGCGRMGRGDMAGVMKHPLARLVAVCDLDSKRLADAKKSADAFYKKKGESVDIKAYADFHEILARPDIDAVIISTPDHWHALCAVHAAIAGKHIYLQKPVTYSIAESIALRKAVLAKKVILQTGSQQRSGMTFRKASEAVRAGRIGKLHTVKIGIGKDKPSGKAPAPMPVPPTFDYERWLGPAPAQPYMEGRVHPQNSVDGRPGWITTEDFGLGMITNWGAHHIDIAQWAMAQEFGGPSTITAKATFMKDDTWTVHEKYHIEMSYPNDVTVILDDSFENGLRFEGSEGWVFCQRGSERVTASDPNLAEPPAGKGPLRASDPKILAPLGSGAVRWQESPDHYANWIEAILTGKEPIAPITQSSRTQQACSAAWIAMKLGRPVKWNAETESFGADAEANALCDRKARKPEYDIHAILKKAGIA